jgi:hypothetical protein
MGKQTFQKCMRQTCNVSHNFVECYDNNEMNISLSGHTLPHTPNAPYYSADTEQQRNPAFAHYAGSGIH